MIELGLIISGLAAAAAANASALFFKETSRWIWRSHPFREGEPSKSPNGDGQCNPNTSRPKMALFCDASRFIPIDLKPYEFAS